jgi:hypothetical protein
MIRGAHRDGVSIDEVRGGLVVALRARQSELEQAIASGVRAVSEPEESEDAEYEAGSRAAISAAVEHCLAGIEYGEGWSGPIPSAAATHARRAARYGVSLDAVLRRYASGDRLLADFVMDEADRFPSQALRQVLRMQGVVLDRLMATIAAEYADELDRAGRSLGQRRAELVRRLLAGASCAPGELDYELGAWHVGVIASGLEAAQTIESIAKGLGCSHLLVPGRDGSAWAWLGGRREPAIADIVRAFSNRDTTEVALAVGEPAKGLGGWRMTHRQAQRALWVALRRPGELTRYADVLLVIPALRDEVLARSLWDVYLRPLAGRRDGGAISRETLRTYFASGRNAATTASVLNVNRHTVERRLHKIEASLGRSLHSCQAELEVALRLEALAPKLDGDADNGLHKLQRRTAKGD